MDTPDPIDGLTLLERAQRLHDDTVRQPTAMLARYAVHRASMAASEAWYAEHQAWLTTMAQEQGARAEQMQVHAAQTRATCAELNAFIQEIRRRLNCGDEGR